MSPRVLLFALLVAGVIGFVWWSTRPQLPPEKAVAERLDEALAAAERRDVGAVMDIVSEQFSHPDFDRKQLRAMLFMRMQQGAWSKVFVVSREITAESDKVVEVSMDAILARGGDVQSIEDVVPDAAGGWHFEMTWTLESDDEWRITRADHDRMRLKDLLP